MFKAVLWDFGGVITSSPFEAFNRFESDRGLPPDIIRSINATNPETNAWAQLESNAISVAVFDDKFAEEAAQRGYDIRGRDVLALLAGEVRPEMVKALDIIRRSYAIGCITNNVKSGAGTGSTEKTGAIARIMGMFEVVIESSKVGIRKPDPGIYTMACEAMGIAPADAVYLDDLGINLKPAKALGMTTIKVLNAGQALDELERHLGLSLR